MSIKTWTTTLATGLGLALGVVAVQAQTVKIGVIASLTGPGAPWGLAAQHGPSLLASEINAKGGIEVGGKKHKVEVIAYDDQYKAADAVAAYNRLVRQDGVKYVIIMSSAATMALKQSVEDDKIIGLTSAASSKAIDTSSRYMFRLYSTAADYAPPFVAWLKNNRQERRVVILNPNDETGWDLNQISEKLYKEAGFNVLSAETFERTTKDFQPLLTKIMATRPELIELSSISPASAGLIVRQARELGYKGLFVKNSGPSPKDIVAAAGKEAAEGMLNLLYVDPANAGYKRLAADYKKAVGHEPNEMVVTFYDAANVLLQAIQKAGDAGDTTKVAAAFPKALPIKSLQGDEISFGGKATSGVDQQFLTTDYIGVIRGGEPVAVGKIK